MKLPIHPEAVAMMERITNSGEPPMETMTVQQAREAANARIIRMNFETPQIGSIEDISIDGPDGDKLRLRLYRPEGASGKLPAVLFFHGGGFVVGSLDTHDPQCAILAKELGALVISTDYRLAPEHKFPAAPRDCAAAVDWVLENLDQLGIDPARIAIAGESAGGTLTALMAQHIAKRQEAIRPVLQVMIYPALDLAARTASYYRLAEGYFFTIKKNQWFIDHYLARPEDALDPRGSPLRAVSIDGVAPALIITAGLDPLLDEGAAYAHRLENAGIRVTYKVYEGWPHGFLFWRETSAAKETMALTVQALRTAFAH